MDEKKPTPNSARWAMSIAACVMFGVMMSLRIELHSILGRVLVAAGAFALLGIAISYLRKNGS